MNEKLQFKSVQDNPQLVSASVLEAITQESGILVAEIDPHYMGGQELSEHYGVDLDSGANCIIVRGKRGELRMMAAILVPVGYRADLNGIVCEHLEARSVSMAPLEEVLKDTGMEYGSITPIGLPSSYKILIDSRLLTKEAIIVGGGKQISKLLVPTSILKKLPNIEVVERLAMRA